MDAVKYLETRKRMSLSGDLSLAHLMEDAVDPEVLVREVERWSASHPLQTRQSVFLEQYPEASLSEHGGCATIGRRCDDCRKEYWMQEVE